MVLDGNSVMLRRTNQPRARCSGTIALSRYESDDRESLPILFHASAKLCELLAESTHDGVPVYGELRDNAHMVQRLIE